MKFDIPMHLFNLLRRLDVSLMIYNKMNQQKWHWLKHWLS